MNMSSAIALASFTFKISGALLCVFGSITYHRLMIYRLSKLCAVSLSTVIFLLTSYASVSAASFSTTSPFLKNDTGDIVKVVTAGRQPMKGLFNVYKSSGKYYYLLPDTLLGREMLALTRFVKTPSGLKVNGQSYAGEKENQQVWKWERRGMQVLLRAPAYSVRADRNSDMYKSVQNSNLDAILYNFDIKAFTKDHTSILIDVTDFFNGDVPAIGISEQLKKSLKITAMDNSRSYIDTIKSFPLNLEARTVKTYKAADAPGDKSNGSVTFELNTSMLLLPKIPAKARLGDERIGYMKQDQTDFGADLQRVEVNSFIHRWKLVPKDTAAYARGELTAPVQPIIFYIDPATPKKWVPYFIAGINDWQKAFEAAGFKEAIIGRVAPTPQEDPGFSLEDARYSTVRYLASEIENAYGDHTADPRTGQIILGQVNWYANLPSIFYDLYFVQTAATNPRARTATPSDEVIGEIIKYVCSHEVGHSLGLTHNWGASYAYPVDSLRSKSFTAKHGTAASVMDYSRFNYVAQPNDGVTQFFPKLGEYDLWAIKWGYSWFPGGMSPERESQMLNNWTKERLGNPLYFFGKEFTMYDPRTQNEDIGDNAMTAGAYGIANLARLVPNLKSWTFREGKNEEGLRHMYNRVIDEYYWLIGHVITNIGGMSVNFKTYDEKIPGYEPVSKVRQEQAVQFLNREVFTTPLWLINQKELSEIDNGVIVQRIKNVQERTIDEVLDFPRLARLADHEIKYGTLVYTVDNLLHELTRDLFNVQRPDAFQRNVQRAYVRRLGKLLTEEPKQDPDKSATDLANQGDTPVKMSLSDIRPKVRMELIRIKGRLSRQNNGTLSYHYDDLRNRINLLLDPQAAKAPEPSND